MRSFWKIQVSHRRHGGRNDLELLSWAGSRERAGNEGHFVPRTLLIQGFFCLCTLPFFQNIITIGVFQKTIFQSSFFHLEECIWGPATVLWATIPCFHCGVFQLYKNGPPFAYPSSTERLLFCFQPLVFTKISGITILAQGSLMCLKTFSFLELNDLNVSFSELFHFVKII